MTFAVEVSGAVEAAASLRGVERHLERDVKAVLSRGALNVKKQMQSDLAGSAHFRSVVPSISYDIDGFDAVIGPEIGKAGGSLAWIAAFGTSTTPASWDFTRGARDEAPNLERFLAEAAAKALR